MNVEFCIKKHQFITEFMETIAQQTAKKIKIKIFSSYELQEKSVK